MNLTGGTVSGYDIGVQVWNNSTAFLTPACNNLSIQSNGSTGVYVADSGVAKIESLAPADATMDCPGRVAIAGNGKYGVLAAGGANAYLYRIAISGHSLDGVQLKNGSTVRINSSTIDAASASGRPG